jgi:hypothetical protein
VHGRIAVGLGLFAALVAAGLHGFSLPSWRAVIDGSQPTEVLLGSPREIRGDDWYVQIPLALGQRAHDPPFPRVNENIGEGQDVILPIATPIAHPITLLRPEQWGFFAGDDFGLAWMWWLRVFGIAAAWSLVAWFVAGRRLGFGLAGGALVLVSPVVQMWSLNPAPFLIPAGLGIAAALALFDSQTRARRVALALVLAFSVASLAVGFYPPYQVSLAWVGVAALAGHGIGRIRADRAWRPNAVALAGGALIGAAIAAAMFWSARDAIAAIAATAYPGRRVSTGDLMPLSRLFGHHLLVTARGGDVAQVVVAATPWLWFPVVAAGEALRFARTRRVDALASSLLLLCAVLVAYACFGAPEFVARTTGLAWLPSARVPLALGVADALLLVRVLARPPEEGETGHQLALFVAVAWVAWIGIVANGVHARRDDLGGIATALLVVANGGVAYAIVRRIRPPIVLGALAAVLAASTLWFNPLVRGGSSFLRENALSQQILAIDREAGGATTWAVFGPPALGNLPRVLGVRSLGGVQPIPQLELWRRLDPEKSDRAIYDRYAHVLFESARSNLPRFRALGLDGFAVRVAPGSPALRRLGATHVLIQMPEPQPEAVLRAMPGLRWITSVGRNHLFALE